MAVKARLYKTGELYSDAPINERLPPITEGLLAYYPLDNAKNIAGYRSISSCKVLAARNSTNAGFFPLFAYFQAQAGSFTEISTTDLFNLAVATAITYDVIICDYCVWGLIAAQVTKLKELADNGVAVIFTGNDTLSSELATIVTVPSAAHTLVPCNNSRVDVSSLAGIAGSGDPVRAISEFPNPYCYPLYRRSNDNYISGYIYESPYPNGGIIYADHEGFYLSINPAYQVIFDYVCSRSVCRSVVTNTRHEADGVALTPATTNLLPFGDFSTYSGWSTTDSPSTPLRALLPGMGYGGRNAVRITKLKNGYTTGYFQISCGFPETVVAGTTYIASIKYKTEPNGYFQLGAWASPDGNQPVWPLLYDVALSGGWRLRAYKKTFTNGGAGGFTFGINSIPPDNEIVFCDYQLEKRSHATPFTMSQAASLLIAPLVSKTPPYTLIFKMTPWHNKDYAAPGGATIYVFSDATDLFIMWKRSAETYYRLRIKDTNDDFLIPEASIVEGQNHIIALIGNTTTTSVYVNGSLIATKNRTANLPDLITFNKNSQGSYSISNVAFYSRALSEQEIKTYGGSQLSIGALTTTGAFYERTNLLEDGLTNNIFNTLVWGGNWDRYAQSKCVPAIVATSKHNNKGCYFIYREPNLVYPASGNVMWGGLILKIPQSCKKIGRTYKVSCWMKGVSSNAQHTSYISYTAGWSSDGVGFTTNQGISGLNHGADFNSKEWVYFEGTYTVAATRWQRPKMWGTTVAGSAVVNLTGDSNTYVSKVPIYFPVGTALVASTYIPACTVQSINTTAKTVTLSSPALASGTGITIERDSYVDTYIDLKIGYAYMSTGSLGTRVFIDDVQITDITDESFVPMRTKATETLASLFTEGLTKIYVQGSSNAGTYFDNTRILKIDGVDKALGSTRGLCLSVWSDPASVTNTYYDVWSGATGQDATCNSLVTALNAIKDNQYWALTSRVASGTNTNLNDKLYSMGAVYYKTVDWTLSNLWSSCYAAFGKGQLCWKEDLRRQDSNNLYYATIEIEY